MKKSYCPNCSQPTVKKETDPNWPFCSKTCKDVDLYHWFSETNVISREITEEDLKDPRLMQQIEEMQKQLESLGPVDPYDPNNF